MKWLAQVIVGPVFVLGAAAGQYKSAYKGVRGLKIGPFKP